MSSNLFSRIALLPQLIKDGKAKYLWTAFLNRLNSKEIAFGFKRDLSVPYKKPRTLKPITIREFKKEDEVFFVDNPNNGLINNFHTCYVGITKDEIPCARVWLIDSSQNKTLKNTWGERFPQLKADEVLLENVFTVPKYRGMGVIPAFLYDVAEKSRELGAKYAITFGEVKNINTSRSYDYAGFTPYIVRTVSYFLFIKSIKYEELSEEKMAFYNKSINRKTPKK
ncbi:hypothetical protein OS188_03165 [Xanthomarina sp. F1114]|uniref:hypothetical protein n=1 Tax=Xanthomarina sp. F1114 TaxID=2996019 RepID=UPI00225E15FF|nr:hypothetical protein [Xanthomarina sp. F1114]MCX7546947.1 hypothetical protein [Xanthomarina sp. F1114]